MINNNILHKHCKEITHKDALNKTYSLIEKHRVPVVQSNSVLGYGKIMKNIEVYKDNLWMTEKIAKKYHKTIAYDIFNLYLKYNGRDTNK